MVIAIGLAIILFGLCGLIHFWTMMTVLNHLKRRNYSALKRMLIAFYSAGFAHLFEAGLYALGFGHLRFLSGVESLNGFLLISCSAAFLFMVMTESKKSNKIGNK